MNMVTDDTFFLYLKGMPEYKDITVIVISNFPKREHENLRDMDPNLMFLDKIVTRERLIGEIKTKIRQAPKLKNNGSRNFSGVFGQLEGGDNHYAL